MSFLLPLIESYTQRDALLCGSGCWSYAQLGDEVRCWQALFDAKGIEAGQGVVLLIDDLLVGVAQFFALSALDVVIFPVMAEGVFDYADSALALHWVVRGEEVTCQMVGEQDEALMDFLAKKRAGLLLLTSGTTAKAKPVLHDLALFLERYASAKGREDRVLAFYHLDHVAGLDVLFSTLHSGSTLIFCEDRTVEAVAVLLRQQRVTVLPCSPSFLRLFFVSGEQDACFEDVAWLVLGSEPVRVDGERLKRVFPQARLLQRFGTTETGSIAGLRSVGEQGFVIEGEDVQVRENLLWLRKPASLLAYLGEEALAVEGGWYCTGDVVQWDDGVLRIVGRQSARINVGGEKVFAEEVEAVLLEHEAVQAAQVYGEPHALLGQVLVAEVLWAGEEGTANRQLRKFCAALSLPRHKVPVRFVEVKELLLSERFKLKRACQ